MKTSSAKSKGRRAVQEAYDLILKYIPELQPDDLVITSSGDTGADLKLSPLARSILPFQFEMKNTERIQIWQAIEQAKTHGPHIPAVVFKRNKQPLYITLSLEDFLSYVEKLRKQDSFSKTQ